MRESRTIVDWLPLIFPLSAVGAKVMAFALMWTGSFLSYPLLLFVIVDALPFHAAHNAREYFAAGGAAPSAEGQLVFGSVLIVLTALQWCGAGVVLRWWFHRRTSAVPSIVHR